MKPIFFKTPAELRRRLAKDHAKAVELWIGFYKVASGKGGITYKQALDEALCFGWIDGKAMSLGEESWMIRFSPRKARSPWSRVNIKRAGELREAGRMRPAGLKAFEGRDRSKDMSYSYENALRALAPAYEKRFMAKRKAWKFWEAQPPGYKRTAAFWVMSAKREETQLRRLATLIEDSAGGRRISLLTSPTAKRT
ncbi:MAG: YdeI/OmpD-associated family protein [Actinomycetota bacterium]